MLRIEVNNHQRFIAEFISALLFAWYVMYQYLESGLELLLVLPLIISITRLKRKTLSKSLLRGVLLIGLSVIPCFFREDWLFGLKLLFYQSCANLAIRAKLFNVLFFVIALAMNVFLHLLSLSFGQVSYFMGGFFLKVAPNYFVFLFVFPLLALRVKPWFVAMISSISLSRWNFFSIIGSYSFQASLILIISAYLNLTFQVTDLTFGLKTSSNSDRLSIIHYLVEHKEEYFWGKPQLEIKADLMSHLNIAVDSFEGLLFDCYGLFGVFGLFLITYHVTSTSNRRNLRWASTYLFAYPFFNPLVYAFAYYLFAEYCALSEENWS